MDESEYFLQQGKYTLADARIEDLANDFKNGVNPLYQIRSFFKKEFKVIKTDNPAWEGLFRRRKAYEIVRDKSVTGCTDIGLVFLSIVRQMGIPARYVESFREDYFDDPKRSMSGHVFVDLCVNGVWSKYDPTNDGLVSGPGYSIGKNKYVPIAKGLDFSDLRLMKEEVLGGNHFSLRNVNGFSELRYKTSDCINQYKRLNGIAIN